MSLKGELAQLTNLLILVHVGAGVCQKALDACREHSLGESIVVWEANYACYAYLCLVYAPLPVMAVCGPRPS